MLNFVYDGNKAILISKVLTSEIPNYKVGTVNWRGTNFVVNLITTKPFNTNNDKKKINSLFPLLKSNLQKQIRRQEIAAVATCELMLELNDFECLRRLSVIAAEDVEISKETSVIVWLMAACSKNYILSVSDKYFILMYVVNLVNHPACKRLTISEEYNINTYETNIYEIINSNHPDKEYLAGIIFRTSYGGLAGDIPMLINLCGYAFSHSLISFSNVKIKETKLEFNDAAVDFHIYPSLCSLISQDTNINEETIKEIIWNCSSKINTRFLTVENSNIWTLIKKSFDIHTKEYLYKIVRQYF